MMSSKPRKLGFALIGESFYHEIIKDPKTRNVTFDALTPMELRFQYYHNIYLMLFESEMIQEVMEGDKIPLYDLKFHCSPIDGENLTVEIVKSQHVDDLLWEMR